MAKKNKKITLNVALPSAPSLDQDNDDQQNWQTRSDASTVRDYANLTQKPDRHQKALEMLDNEHRAMRGILRNSGMEDDNDSPNDTIQPRDLARSGRKKSARVPRATAGRR